MSSRALPPWISSSLIGWCIVGLLITACGLWGPSSSPPPVVATVIISSTGVSPAEQTISAPGRVAFNVVDDVSHSIMSGPHPQHDGCPALNVGGIGPKSIGTSEVLRTLGVCQFHDDLNLGDARFQGTIRVQ